MSQTAYSSEGIEYYQKVAFYEHPVKADTTCPPLVAQYVPATDEKDVVAIWCRLKDIKRHYEKCSTT